MPVVEAVSRLDTIVSVIESGASVCQVHIYLRGEPRTMQEQTLYREVLIEVREFLEDRVRRRRAAGIAQRRAALYPGFGLRKSLDHNLKFLKRLCEQRLIVQAHRTCSV